MSAVATSTGAHCAIGPALALLRLQGCDLLVALARSRLERSDERAEFIASLDLDLGADGCTGLALAIFTVQIAIAQLWLRHFRFGPLEWAWRTAVYLRPPPMRVRRS